MSDYIASSPEELQAMLDSLGLKDLDALTGHLPEAVLLKEDGWDLPEGMSEFEALAKLKKMASHNRIYEDLYRGAGAYRHYIPSLVNALSSRGEFLTAYTPYQAEMSQGLLQSIFEYQTMICELTGMDVSNASVYDGATAAAEALLMCRDPKHRRVLVPASVHPQILQVIRTYGEAYGMEITVLECPHGVLEESVLREALSEDTACLLLQQPNYFGLIEDAETLFAAAAEKKVKGILHINPIAAALLPSAKEAGAVIAVGEGQPLGMPLNFGGPYLGFMASVSAMMRKLPGRIVGQSTDHGPAGLRSDLAPVNSIRREKASSSICSNQALCALRAAIYCSAMGTEGIEQVASHCVSNAHYLAQELCEKTKLKLKYTGEFFHEFVTVSEVPSGVLLKHLEDHGILGGLPLSDHEILWCATEVNNKENMDHLVELIGEVAA
ncbi:MAG: aminomethyl-transferring glycine dehydrogenase subunit GcvPA [Holdemania filiformis]